MNIFTTVATATTTSNNSNTNDMEKKNMQMTIKHHLVVSTQIFLISCITLKRNVATFTYDSL
jgi:hypothetical protein